MKEEVIKSLKEKEIFEIYTEERYDQVVAVMQYGCKASPTLKAFLSISPDFRVDWIVDHMVRLVAAGKI